MKTKDVLLEEIKDKLIENRGITIFYSNSKRERNRNRNSVVRIKEERFVVVKPEITQGNKGIVLQQLKDASRKENLPKIEKFVKSKEQNASFFKEKELTQACWAAL
jgi:hypothetical protein